MLASDEGYDITIDYRKTVVGFRITLTQYETDQQVEKIYTCPPYGVQEIGNHGFLFSLLSNAEETPKQTNPLGFKRLYTYRLYRETCVFITLLSDSLRCIGIFIIHHK